jgi:hypothetical protein
LLNDVKLAKTSTGHREEDKGTLNGRNEIRNADEIHQKLIEAPN